FLHYDHRDIGDRPLGYIVENRVLRRMLWRQARRLSSLAVLAPATVAGVTSDDSGADAVLTDGRRLRAALVAAADGRLSPLRTAAGIGAVTWSYPQTGIVCTIHHQEPHRGIAVEHFLPAGPFA